MTFSMIHLGSLLWTIFIGLVSRILEKDTKSTLFDSAPRPSDCSSSDRWCSQQTKYVNKSEANEWYSINLLIP